MFLSKDTKELKWYWLDQKIHTLSISNNGENLDLKDLNETAIKLTKEKEEQCKTIGYLGLALTGNPDAAWGFVLGWLLRSIKKNENWQINHSEEVISKEELKTHMIEIFRNYADMIEKGDLNNSIKSTPNIGSDDGTSLFK